MGSLPQYRQFLYPESHRQFLYPESPRLFRRYLASPHLLLEVGVAEVVEVEAVDRHQFRPMCYHQYQCRWYLRLVLVLEEEEVVAAVVVGRHRYRPTFLRRFLRHR